MQLRLVRAIQTGHRHQVGRLVAEADARWLTIQLPSGRKLHYRKPDLVEVRAPWSEGHEGTITLKDHNEEVTNKVLELLEQLEVDHEDLDGLSIKVKQILNPAKKRLYAINMMKRFGLQLSFEEKEPQYIHQIEYMSVNSVSRKWSKTRTYGGKLADNITQAIARDFLVEAMLRLEQRGYPIIATIHDEVVCEVPNTHGSLEEFEQIMKQVPTWGAGCPIGVEGYEAERYRK